VIIFDLYLNSYSYIIFLPFFSYLIKKKRAFHLYFLYGLLLDLCLFNKFFLNVIFFIIIYFLYPRKTKKLMIYFNVTYFFLFLINLFYFGNISLVYKPVFYYSYIINLLYYKMIHKNYYF